VNSAIALAPAKINIGLEITHRRDDGYHEIVTVMQAVSLYDRFVWRETGDSFEYQSPDNVEAGADLVRRALGSLPEDTRLRGRLELKKQIPISAGMGGGSSDAALALIVAHKERDAEELERYAANLGSDVPFFLRGGTSLASGTGTTLEQLPDQDRWCVVVVPEVDIDAKTRTFYQSLDPDDFSDGQEVRNVASMLWAGQLIRSPPPNAFTRLLMSYPQVESAWLAMENAGAPWVSISGAGPSIYTLVQTFTEARSIHTRVCGSHTAYVVRTLPANVHLIGAEKIAAAMAGSDRAR
jgi:4-diphosphocytidyl-2-C-methyl-D-erythritol kinase